MDYDKLQEPLLQNECMELEGADWRTGLQQGSRERILNTIMETLKRHLPLSGQEQIKKIAVRYEEEIYTEATSQSDYLRKISVKMLKMEADSKNCMVNSLQSNAASNSEDAQPPASESMQSEMQNHVHKNVQSTGVPNSAGSIPALSPVDGKFHGTMPSVPVQNHNVPNMLNATPFALMQPMMPANSMSQFGQGQIQGGQQVGPQQLQLQQMKLFQMQQQQLHLQQQAKALAGATQQRVQSTGPMLQEQTTINQLKQFSQSQGNMAGLKLTSQSMLSQIKNQVQNNVPSTGVLNSAGAPNSLQSNAATASNSENAQDPASQSMQSQMEKQVQQLPTPTVSDQSQVQSQNIQNNIASPEVPNSAGSTPALPIDDKSQVAIPSVSVNPNMQNMFNATLSAPRQPVLQGWPTNSMFGFGRGQIQGGKQQVMPPFIVPSHNQHLQNMNLLQTNQAMVQRLMQQQRLGMQLQANTMLQGPTTIDQLKSQSQGNMPDSKLSTNLDSEKNSDSPLKKSRNSVSSLQQAQLHLDIQQSPQQQPQSPSNEAQVNSKTQPMKIQGSTMPTQPNNSTSLQHNTLSSSSSSGLTTLQSNSQQQQMQMLSAQLMQQQQYMQRVLIQQQQLQQWQMQQRLFQEQQQQWQTQIRLIQEQQQQWQLQIIRLFQEQQQQYQMQQRLFQQQQQGQQNFHKQSEQLLVQQELQQQQNSQEQSGQLTTGDTVLAIFVLIMLVAFITLLLVK